MKVFSTLSALVLTLGFLGGSPVFASGGAGGGNNSWATSSGADYDVGKRVFQNHVVCDSCPHPNPELDYEKLSIILKDVHRSGQIGRHLNIRERKSVKLFIKERYNI